MTGNWAFAAALIAAALLVAAVVWLTRDRTDRELRRLTRAMRARAIASGQPADQICPPGCPACRPDRRSTR